MARATRELTKKQEFKNELGNVVVDSVGLIADTVATARIITKLIRQEVSELLLDEPTITKELLPVS